MNQDYSKAVSFTNSYCVLADGLVTGLEKCLAENVILDWFGKTIKGRTNVAAFLNTHKVNSRHVFNNITPTESIGYNKKPSRRSRRYSKSKISKNSSIYNSSINGNSPFEDQSSLESTPINKIVSSGERSRSSRKLDMDGNHTEESDLTLELHDDDLSTNFKLLNIKSTNVEEIEQQINRISLEKKLNIKSPTKKQCNEFNGSENVGILDSMRYVEAFGEILFSKKSRRQCRWSESKIISSTSQHTWRKPCKLQIAYSQKICLQQILNKSNNTISFLNSSNSTESKSKLLSYAEINEHNKDLVQPNVNKFVDCRRNINCTKEEENFYWNLEEHLSKNEAKELGLIPRYADVKSVFQKINCDDEDESKSQNNFIFNHLIHVIIYEGRSRCRMNLSQKFV